MSTGSCSIYNNTFFGDLCPYTIKQNLEDSKWKIIFQTETGPVSEDLNISRLPTQTPEATDYWKPYFITKSDSNISNKPILGKTQVKNPILGHEGVISFRPVFKHWSRSDNLTMSCNWFISSMTGGSYPEYGVLYWYRKNSGKKYPLKFENIPDNLPVYAKSNITKDGNVILLAGSLVTKISDTMLYNRSRHNHYINGTEGNFTHSEKDSFIDISHLSPSDKKDLFSLSPSNAGDTEIWIPDGEALSYYHNNTQKNRHNTSKIASYSYLSPGLFPIYREIFDRITRRMIKKNGLTRKQSFALQKLCYFLSTSPLTDRTTVSFWSTQLVTQAMEEFINKDHASVDTEKDNLLTAINSIMPIFQDLNNTPARRTVNNNCIVTTEGLVNKVLQKYGAVIAVPPGTSVNLSYSGGSNMSNHIITSLGYVSTYNSSIPNTTTLYNNTQFRIGEITYQTDMTADHSTVKISSTNSGTSCEIPLADAKLPAIYAPDLFAGGIINIDHAPGATSAGSVDETVFGFDQWNNFGASLESEAKSSRYSWEPYGGSSCVRFSNNSIDLNAFGRPIYPPQMRFDTTTDSTPAIFLKPSGLYDLKVTRTLYKNVSQSDILTINVGGMPFEFTNVPFSPVNQNYSKILCSSLKTFASHKQGLLWLLDSDHYYDKGYGTDSDDYPDLFGIVRLKDIKLDLQSKLNITSNNGNGLYLTFTGGNAGFWILSASMEHMRDSSDKHKNCKSFYREKIVRKADSSSSLILGASDFSRDYPSAYSFSAKSCGKQDVSDISFGGPTVSTRLSPVIYAYGGYEAARINDIGIEIPGHPEVSYSCKKSLPTLSTRNDFGFKANREKAFCFPVEVAPTGDTAVVFSLGNFNPAEGWGEVVTTAQMLSYCGCSATEVSGYGPIEGPEARLPFSDFDLAEDAVAGSKTLILDGTNHNIKRFSPIFRRGPNQVGIMSTLAIRGGAPDDGYISKIEKDEDNNITRLILDKPLLVNMKAKSVIRIYDIFSKGMNMCPGTGTMFLSYNKPMLEERECYNRYRFFGLNSEDQVIEMANTGFLGKGNNIWIDDGDKGWRDTGISKGCNNFPSVPSEGGKYKFSAQVWLGTAVPMHKRCDVISGVLTAEMPCVDTRGDAEVSCPTWRPVSNVISRDPQHQQCFTFKGGGFSNIRPSSEYQSNIYITSGNAVYPNTANKYGVGGIDSLTYSNYTSRTFGQYTENTWFNSDSPDGILSSGNTCGYQYTQYAADLKLENTKIANIDVKLNFLNYFNPKNLQIWLEVYDEDNVKKDIPLLHKEYVNNYVNNFTITFSDFTRFNTAHDEGKILPSTRIEDLNKNENDFDLDLNSINSINSPTSNLSKLHQISGQKLIGSKFRLCMKTVNYLINDANILDNLSYNDQASGNSIVSNKAISNVPNNSMCSWEVIVYTKDIKNPVSYDYTDSIDYSIVNWRDIFGTYEPVASGIEYLADFTGRQHLLPNVNINAPYQSLANYNTCFYTDEALGKNPYVNKPEFPSLLPYFMAGLGFGFGTVVGGLVALSALQSFYANGGRNDPIVNYFIETRLSNQTETTNGQYYKAVYTKQYFGQANRAIVCISTDNIFWYGTEVPIYRYINTPTFRRNVYDYIQILSNEDNNKKAHLYNLPYTVISKLEDINLDTGGIGLYFSNANKIKKDFEDSNGSLFGDGNYLLLDGVRPSYIFSAGGQSPERVLLSPDQDTIKIFSITPVSTIDGVKTIMVLSDKVKSNTGYVGKIKKDTILMYKKDQISIIDGTPYIGKWSGEKTGNEIFSSISPTKHSSSYSPGSIGWGTNQVRTDVLSQIKINSPNIPTSEIIDYRMNNQRILNDFFVIEASGQFGILVSGMVEDIRGYTTTFEDFGAISHSGIPISAGNHTLNDKGSPFFLELKSDYFPSMVSDPDYNFSSGLIHIENDFKKNNLDQSSCGASANAVERKFANVDPKNIMNWYWIAFHPEQDCFLIDELTLKEPMEVELKAVAIVGDIVTDDTSIYPRSSVNGGPISLTSSGNSYKYVIQSSGTIIDGWRRSVAEDRPPKWTGPTEIFTYGSNDPTGGDSKKLLMGGVDDLAKDTLIAIRETYLRPVSPLGSNIPLKRLIGLTDSMRIPDSSTKLRVKFRNIPRQLKSVDSESFEKYIYDKSGNLSKGNGTFSRARSVGQLANNFVCWRCIGVDGKPLSDPPAFFKVMNEMHYRAFFGSSDLIEHKGDFMDTQDAWEWIPYELYASPSALTLSGSILDFSDYDLSKGENPLLMEVINTPIGSMNGVMAGDKLKITYHIPSTTAASILISSVSTPCDSSTISKSIPLADSTNPEEMNSTEYTVESEPGPEGLSFTLAVSHHYVTSSEIFVSIRIEFVGHD
jgi:hypothetical protein